MGLPTPNACSGPTTSSPVPVIGELTRRSLSAVSETQGVLQPAASLGGRHIPPRQRNPGVDKLLQPQRAAGTVGAPWAGTPTCCFPSAPPAPADLPGHGGLCPPYRNCVRGHCRGWQGTCRLELLSDLTGLITRQWEPLSFPGFSQGQLQQLNWCELKYYGPQTSPQKMET